MGHSISWIAVRSADVSPVLAEAQLRLTETSDPELDHSVSGALLRTGWYLIVARDPNHRLISDAVMQRISGRWTCVACSVEEHVMCSSAALWSDGSQRWKVLHDAQAGMFDLQLSGLPPEHFPALRDKIFASQRAEGGEEAEVDLVFDLPLQLAQQLVGFKHDEVSAAIDGVIPMALEDVAPPPKKAWWKVW